MPQIYRSEASKIVYDIREAEREIARLEDKREILRDKVYKLSMQLIESFPLNPNTL